MTDSASSKMLRRALFALLTVFFGIFAGSFAWAFFFLMDLGINLLWRVIPQALESAGMPAVFYPIVFCTLGGLVIGLFTNRFGDYPESMNEVLAKVKKTGRYEYDHIGSSFFGALLPLLFGGSIGPEAGLTGVIAGLCTWMGDRLRFVGAEMRELAEAGTAAVITAIFSSPLFGLVVPIVGRADESDGAKPVSEVRLGVEKPLKVAIYLLAAAAALGALVGLNELFHQSAGLPHFSDFNMGPTELRWGIPVICIGAIAGWLYYPFGKLGSWVSEKLGRHVVIKPVIAGVLLGTIGVFLPFAMFAGESQTEEIAAMWTTLGPALLIITGFAKVFTTQLCLNLGWRGGHFFPLIFAGICIGYGCSALTGADPVFCLCASSSALLGAVMRQPVLCALLLFLVFPVKSVVVLIIAAALGSLLPIPESWKTPKP